MGVFDRSRPEQAVRNTRYHLEPDVVSCRAVVIRIRVRPRLLDLSHLGYLDDATEAVEVDEAELSVVCGCLSPAPTAVPTTSPTDFGGEESSCNETESVEITSDSAPNLEGWVVSYVSSNLQLEKD